MGMLSSFNQATTTLFDTATQSLMALNRLARAGAHRTIVIEEKSEAAAAISSLRNEYDVASEIQAIYKQGSGITESALEEGRAFLSKYKAMRREAEMGDPILKEFQDVAAEIKSAVKKTKK